MTLAERDAMNRARNANWRFPRLKRKSARLPRFVVARPPDESEHCGVREWAPLKLVKGE